MKTKIIFLCAVFLLTQAITYGQKTKISVQKGKVVAQTAGGSVIVDAGKKVILTQDENPSVTVDDPMVDDIMQIYKWVEAEKHANRIKIEFTSIQVKSIESEDFLTGAALMEIPNMKSEPSDTARIGLTSILDNPKYYDLSGNLLTFELDKLNEHEGYYYLYFTKLVNSGDNFRFISVSQASVSDKVLWKEGNLWKFRAGNCTPNCLNYFRIILPESAIFVDSSRPVTMFDSFNGRVAVTIRNYTGANSDGMYQISFLWPDKDDTTLADLPPGYRGLESGLAEMYQQQIEKILEGERFDDLSTPVNALLTNRCAIFNKDKDLFIKSSYDFKIKHGLFAKMSQDLLKDDAKLLMKILDKIGGDYINELLLDTPNWPDKPENEYIHPIYMAERGSQTRSDTMAIIYDDGNWYYLGNAGNPREYDVNVFKSMLGKTEKTLIQGLPKFFDMPSDKPTSEDLQEFMAIYNKLKTQKVDYFESWFVTGATLFAGGLWEQALDCFNRCEQLHRHDDSDFYIMNLVFQGYVYDVWGQRQKALEKYNRALDIVEKHASGAGKAGINIKKKNFFKHGGWGLRINYDTIKVRLETPFTKEMISK